MNCIRPVFDFGRFRLDPVERVLLCDGKPVHLVQKALSVLLVLTENHGRIVEKDDLMRQVWPDAFVEEANLTQSVALARRALQDNNCPHEYVETVHRRGYRFIAEVKIVDEYASLGAEKANRTLDRDNGGVEARSRQSASASAMLTKRYAENDEAHHLYLRGRYYWTKYTVEGLNKGIDCFRQAIAIDADYSMAYVGLADCYYRLSNIHLPPRKAMPKAKRAVLKALKIDETLAEAHALLGLIRMFYDRNWSAAEIGFKRAVELDPRSALAHKRYGWALGMLGYFDESIPEMNRALDLEPRSPDVHVGLGIILHLARRYDAAIAQAQLALDIQPEFFPAHVLSGIAHVQQSKLTEAVAELREAASLADVPWTLGYLGYAYGVSGKRRRALKVLTELAKRSEGAYVSPYTLALIHAGLDQKEQALQLLGRTCEDRNEMMGFVKLSPELDGFRSDQRFAALLNRSRFSAKAA